ncbi:hypothetical protein AF70_00002630 [Pseudomonas sp. KD5]|uniref:Uncharacterized protein n=1 Tax=Pseudomonas umsongensis TaxID=198618 RepID=A0ACC5M907_9PSED|nr:hypothetical protein [Pseudomonas umsongensis]NMN74746.1 hypothetical protein [Pseudomonas sp. KD5]CAH0242890.1 hypothetical protein SRABI123_02936 [Pseudomonas sp. Bi123]
MGIRAGDSQQKVFIPKGVKGIDQPEVIVRIFNQSGSVILAVDFCPLGLNRLSACQVDVVHIAEVEPFVSPENSRQFAAQLCSCKSVRRSFASCLFVQKVQRFWQLASMAMQVETVFANVDTEKRHRVHERSSAENEKSPASVNLQGFSVRLTISLNPEAFAVRVFCFSTTISG